MILGLDISTSCTGWCLLHPDGSFFRAGCIPLAKHKDMFSKAQEAEKHIDELIKDINITSIAIEQNLQSFRSGFSSAHTLYSLARFNGVLSYICFKKIGIKPTFLNVNSSRKSLGIKLIREKVCGISTKDQILEWTRPKLEVEGYVWPRKTLKSGPRKGQTIMDPSCYDIADAFIVAKSSLIEH